jgi:hypothetical protein
MSGIEAAGFGRSFALARAGDTAESTIAALLDAAEPLPDAHVLVIGPRSLDIVCGLIRRGCAAALEIPLAGPSSTEPAELVIVPGVDSLEQATAAASLARRSLLPCGRIVMLDTTGRFATSVALMLRRAGVSGVRSRPIAGGILLRADWPMFGLGRERHHA